MIPTPVYRPVPDRPMRVAAFMSGSGTNLVKIVEHQRRLEAQRGGSPFQVVLVFTDNRDSRAAAISAQFGLPLITNDIMDFYRSRGQADKKDLSLRPEFDLETLAMLPCETIDVVALAGYMSIVTSPLLAVFDGRMVNVHPADLGVRDGERRRYTGARAVEAAIRAGETTLRSSVHIVREQVDYGEVLVRSAPLPVVIPDGTRREDFAGVENKAALRRLADEHQDRLKEAGDWRVFPLTLEMLARGRFGFDETGGLCFDGEPARAGVWLDEHGALSIAPE